MMAKVDDSNNWRPKKTLYTVSTAESLTFAASLMPMLKVPAIGAGVLNCEGSKREHNPRKLCQLQNEAQ